MAVRPTQQLEVIGEADAAFRDNPASAEAIDSSPFLSMPGQVADIVTKLV
ncbi:hypothetical protein OG252_02225 [Streptomyces sp. NBC_01352]|nr:MULTISPECIES: hypothetical protein [unclassified Streptomyces]MCX4706618.1 hypothetical protein [Streptomyces sp. NBC_01373]